MIFLCISDPLYLNLKAEERIIPMPNPENLLSKVKELSSNLQPADGLSRADGSILSSDKSSSTCLRRLGADTKIVVGNAGDHPLVLQLLYKLTKRLLPKIFRADWMNLLTNQQIDCYSAEAVNSLVMRRFLSKLVGFKDCVVHWRDCRIF